MILFKQNYVIYFIPLERNKQILYHTVKMGERTELIVFPRIHAEERK